MARVLCGPVEAELFLGGVSHGVAVGCEKDAPLGRIPVGALVPTAPPSHGCTVNAPSPLTGPPGAPPFRRTEGAFPSPAHGNAVGKTSDIKSTALKGRPKRNLST